MQREGIFREMKVRLHYEKPSERRIREKSEAIRRACKLAHKELQYYFCCAFARMIRRPERLHETPLGWVAERAKRHQ